MINLTCEELYFGILDSTVSQEERKIEADYIRQAYKDTAKKEKNNQ